MPLSNKRPEGAFGGKKKIIINDCFLLIADRCFLELESDKP